MRILILCTGNSCRSQMAEGFLRSFDDSLEVYSAGTAPAPRVSSRAIAAMKEVGIDISDHKPKHINDFVTQSFDYVITVCDNAKESCPVFVGKVKTRLHIGFNDPTESTGSEEQIFSEFRRVRDQIKTEFYDFYQSSLKQK